MGPQIFGATTILSFCKTSKFSNSLSCDSLRGDTKFPQDHRDITHCKNNVMLAATLRYLFSKEHWMDCGGLKKKFVYDHKLPTKITFMLHLILIA